MSQTAPKASTLAAVEATRFLQLLGKDPAAAWFRAIAPRSTVGGKANHRRGGSDLQGFSAAELEADAAQEQGLYVVIGDALKATGKAGAITDDDITGVPALFVEWDDRPIEWQATAWQELGLPEPTVMVATGGKSIHAYWALEQPLAPSLWRTITRRLIAHCGSDPACSNPSRVMRLPGSPYRDKTTGEITGRACIVHESNRRYGVGELEGCIPTPPPPPQAPPTLTVTQQPFRDRAGNGSACDLPPRGMDQIQQALSCIPRREPGQNNYGAPLGDRNTLWGLVAAVAEAGGTIEQAIALMEAHSPSATCGWDVEQVARSGDGRIGAGSFWSVAQAHGYSLTRSDIRRPEEQSATPAPGTPEAIAQAVGASWVKGRFRPRPGTQAKWGERRMGHTKAMRCFDRCVTLLARRERNSLTRRARLLRAARALGLHQDINRQEISQRVLTAKDEHQGNTYQGLTAEQRLAMEWPEVEWLVPDLLPANDLSIIGGRPKVGKTAFAMAVAAAVLTGTSVAGCPQPTTTRPVVVISDDAGDADTAKALTQLGVFHHPNLLWSRHFRLIEADLDRLLRDIEQNPGAVVILDSLRSVARHLEKGENDPEIGAVIYDLKEAVTNAGGSLVLIHHCNKAEGLAGVEALSGHNAISGAANTVITLHHVTDANGKPNKEATQRRLYREGRSGLMLDWVIARTAGGGTFHQVSTWSAWQEQAKEAEAEAKRESRRTQGQREVLAVLDQQPGEWLTARQVAEELGFEWGAKGNGTDASRIREALKRLAREGLVQEVRAGSAYTYSSKGSGHYKPRTPKPPRTPCAAMDPREGPKPRTPRTPRTPLQVMDSRSEDSEVSEVLPQTRENLCPNDSEVSEVSEAPCVGGVPRTEAAAVAGAVIAPPGWPSWGYDLLDLRAADPQAHPNALANALHVRCGVRVDGRQVSQWLTAWSQQQEAA